MNQVEAQLKVRELLDTLKIAFPMACAAHDVKAEELRDGIAQSLRDAIAEEDATAAAIVAMWFVSRAPRSQLLAFLMFLEEDESPDEEWPDEVIPSDSEAVKTD